MVQVGENFSAWLNDSEWGVVVAILIWLVLPTFFLILGAVCWSVVQANEWRWATVLAAVVSGCISYCAALYFWGYLEWSSRPFVVGNRNPDAASFVAFLVSLCFGWIAFKGVARSLSGATD